MWYHHQWVSEWVSGIRRYWTDLYLVRSPNELFTLRRRAEQLRKNCSETRGCGIESEWVDEFLYVCVSECEQFCLNCSAILLKVSESCVSGHWVQVSPMSPDTTGWVVMMWHATGSSEVGEDDVAFKMLNENGSKVPLSLHLQCYSHSVTDFRPQLSVTDQPDCVAAGLYVS